MIRLSEDKQRVLDTSGNLLIMGGPGSGKTTIALLKAHHDSHSGLLRKHQKILLLSFARATITRIEQSAKKILRDYDKESIEISTYHSFAWNLLRCHGHLLVPHRIHLLPPHAASSKLSSFSNEEDRDSEKNRLFVEEGLLHFDLFAKKLATLLRESYTLSRIVSNAYPIIILDEFQDTNKDEWEFIMELGKNSTLIALADPEQRIYDFRGASPARIGQFIDAFKPQEFDFGIENNRSNGTDIVQFGNDILAGRNKNRKYSDVQIYTYTPRKNNNHLYSIKGHILKRLNDKNKKDDWSLAILVPANKLMMNISDVLGKKNDFSNGRSMPAINHEVAMDLIGPSIAAVILSAILEASSLRECKMETILSKLPDYVLGRRGDKSVSLKDQALAGALRDYLEEGDYSKKIRGKARQLVLDDCVQIAKRCNLLHFTGNVASDWHLIREALRTTTSDCLQKIYEDSSYIRLLYKGSQLNNSLALLWRNSRNYEGASDAVAEALAQEHFSASTRTWTGISVMTIFKSKGKEFDEVIIMEGSYDSRFITNNDLDKAKLVLRVAVTRAKTNAIILTPKPSPCPLLV